MKYHIIRAKHTSIFVSLYWTKEEKAAPDLLRSN